MTQFIKNSEELSVTPARKHILEIAEVAFNAIDTKSIVQRNLKIDKDILYIGDKKYNLREYKRVRLIGFGKVSCIAIAELERIFGSRINDGIAIDKKVSPCNITEVFEGSHPRPSSKNVEISERIVFLAKESNEDDLVIVVVSGGGSALLCYPMSECEQGIKLYDEFLGLGGTISELNLVRKHISLLKGGGLVKFLYPATVIGLIFSDVPGNKYDDVASGPTYKDETSINDARAILEKYNIADKFELSETPKDDVFFEKVYNVPLVSSESAIIAMKKKAEELGYPVFNLGGELYDFTEGVINKFNSIATLGSVVIGGGEPRIIIKNSNGTGGRNQYVALSALKVLGLNDTFVAFASDGIDNKSIYAGAIADKEVMKIANEKGLDIDEHLRIFDTEGLLKEANSLLVTGDTGSNVSDLFVMIREK